MGIMRMFGFYNKVDRHDPKEIEKLLDSLSFRILYLAINNFERAIDLFDPHSPRLYREYVMSVSIKSDFSDSSNSNSSDESSNESNYESSESSNSVENVSEKMSTFKVTIDEKNDNSDSEVNSKVKNSDVESNSSTDSENSSDESDESDEITNTTEMTHETQVSNKTNTSNETTESTNSTSICTLTSIENAPKLKNLNEPCIPPSTLNAPMINTEVPIKIELDQPSPELKKINKFLNTPEIDLHVSPNECYQSCNSLKNLHDSSSNIQNEPSESTENSIISKYTFSERTLTISNTNSEPTIQSKEKNQDTDMELNSDKSCTNKLPMKESATSNTESKHEIISNFSNKNYESDKSFVSKISKKKSKKCQKKKKTKKVPENFRKIKTKKKNIQIKFQSKKRQRSISRESSTSIGEDDSETESGLITSNGNDSDTILTPKIRSQIALVTNHGSHTSKSEYTKKSNSSQLESGEYTKTRVKVKSKRKKIPKYKAKDDTSNRSFSKKKEENIYKLIKMALEGNDDDEEIRKMAINRILLEARRDRALKKKKPKKLKTKVVLNGHKENIEDAYKKIMKCISKKKYEEKCAKMEKVSKKSRKRKINSSKYKRKHKHYKYSDESSNYDRIRKSKRSKYKSKKLHRSRRSYSSDSSVYSKRKRNYRRHRKMKSSMSTTCRSESLTKSFTSGSYESANGTSPSYGSYNRDKHKQRGIGKTNRKVRNQKNRKRSYSNSTTFSSRTSHSRDSRKRQPYSSLSPSSFSREISSNEKIMLDVYRETRDPYVAARNAAMSGRYKMVHKTRSGGRGINVYNDFDDRI
ncbi:hypothetical protein A3Q56_05309 [Intoshia linei]|uniref:Uncharacterized protein n=1 Tax=Intoshia linei TaxID=1819745 RepID=A0A177B0L9_9BILA|nr:hypothetical protein A3Q56_05309 [Intoshia linei]